MQEGNVYAKKEPDGQVLYYMRSQYTKKEVARDQTMRVNEGFAGNGGDAWNEGLADMMKMFEDNFDLAKPMALEDHNDDGDDGDDGGDDDGDELCPVYGQTDTYDDDGDDGDDSRYVT